MRCHTPSLDIPVQKKLIGTSLDSVSRVAADRTSAARSLDPSDLDPKLNAITKPGSIAGGMKKAGIALILTPDPITGAVGVPLVAASYAMKKREPASLSNLAEETRRVLRDLQSLSL